MNNRENKQLKKKKIVVFLITIQTEIVPFSMHFSVINYFSVGKN